MSVRRTYGGWIVMRYGDPGKPETQYHTIPIGDDRDHDSAPGCWCQPRQDEPYQHWVHRSKDGREDYEQGYRKPH